MSDFGRKWAKTIFSLDPKPLKCPKCDFQDSCRGLLRNHKEVQHKQLHKCETCEYTTSNKTNLRNHIEKVMTT